MELRQYAGAGVWVQPGTHDYQINVSMWGIGDHALGLLTACGLARETGKKVAMSVHFKYIAQWLEWYDSGVSFVHGAEKSEAKQFYTHDNYDRQLAERTRHTRINYYCAATGHGWARPKCVLPREESNVVILAPWAEHYDRQWPAASYWTLAKLLRGAGYRPVVIDRKARPYQSGFECEVLVGRSPQEVTTLIRAAAWVVANESGIAHIAGLCETPCVVLCGIIEGEKVHGVYPTTRVLNGPLGCTGCHTRSALWQANPLCKTFCASLAAITPERVLAEMRGEQVQSIAITETPRLPLSTLTEEQVHAHVPEEKAHLFHSFDGGSAEDEVCAFVTGLVRVLKPARILETGTYKGHLAGVLRAACDANGFGSVTSLEIDAGLAAIASEKLTGVEVVRANSVEWLREYQGPAFDLAVLDSDLAARVEELKILRDRKLAKYAFVHDASRHRSKTVADMPGFPAALDAVGLPSVESSLSRGWRLFQL